MGRSARTALISLAVLLAASSTLAASSSGLSVDLHMSRRIAFRGAVGSIIVGDPKIADATVVDSHSVVVTGLGYGRTNLIVVDKIGNTLFDGPISVDASDGGRVNLYRAVTRTSYVCSPHCESSSTDPTSSTTNGAGGPAAPQSGGPGSTTVAVTINH